MTYDDIQMQAYALKLKPGQRADILHKLVHDERFPALLSVLQEFHDDLAKACGDYTRSPEERALDAGGLATILKLTDTLEQARTKAEPSPNSAVPPPG